MARANRQQNKTLNVRVREAERAQEKKLKAVELADKEVVQAAKNLEAATKSQAERKRELETADCNLRQARSDVLEDAGGAPEAASFDSLALRMKEMKDR